MSTADEWQGMYRVAAARAEAAEAKVKELEAEARWIPVGERFPDAGVLVLVCNEKVFVGHRTDMGWREDFHGSRRVYNVTHWRPMPKPQEGK